MKTILVEATLVLLVATLVPAHAQEKNPDRNVYFGETHLHTSWSMDAWVMGNQHTGPAEAYQYFKGQPIKHPMGFEMKIETPLDWGAVTDHSEYVGVTRLANDPSSPISKLPATQGLILKNNSFDEMQRVYFNAMKVLNGPPNRALASPEIAGTVWKENAAIAEKANVPGKFTTFCAYEWTSMPNGMNLHRNVFFRDCAKVPAVPYSSLDSFHPEDLWKWMDGQRNSGNEVLAISHNANLSDGRMYPTDVDSYGRPIDASYAASRDRNEPLVELKQLKGSSETHPLLSPTDEFANFELLNYLLTDPVGRIAHMAGSFARQALKDGITMQDTQGFNPYKFGFEAASDSHNSAAGYRQDNYFGGHAMGDGNIRDRMSGKLGAGLDPRTVSTGGLTGVWAEENTRAAIFDAMKRKETYALSGPHIKARLFGGWTYSPEILTTQDWVKGAYAKGVPMGGDLPPAAGKAPTFIVWAVKDPASGNLDRIQIIKGWTKSGQSFEKIYDVAWAGQRKPDKLTGDVPPIGSTVNIETATYTNTIGAVELKTVWTDPAFDPSLHAFYYARVLEIPTPRWTTIQAKELGIAPPDVVSATVQERAWTSPIWYTPSAEARKNAKAGVTVADLKKNGAVALNDSQVTALIVEKSLWLQNTVTGEKFQMIFSASGKSASGKPAAPLEPGYVTERFAANQGQYTVKYLGRNASLPSLTVDAALWNRLGDAGAYYINEGKIVIALVGTPIEIAVYKAGDKYLGARSNEFGFANYELIPAVAELNPLR